MQMKSLVYQCHTNVHKHPMAYKMVTAGKQSEVYTGTVCTTFITSVNLKLFQIKSFLKKILTAMTFQQF